MSQTTDHEKVTRVGSLSENTDGDTHTTVTTTKQSEPEIVFDRKRSSDKLVQMQATANDMNGAAASNDSDEKQEAETTSHKSDDKNLSRGDSVKTRKLTITKSTIDALQGAQDEITPEHILCCEIKQDRKALVIGLQFLVVFGIVLSYFIYKMIQLFDTDSGGANRNEYIINESVDDMPIPYIYIDISSNGSCFMYIELDKDDYPTNYSWLSGYDDINNVTNSSTMSSILDATESDGVIISNYYWGWNQFWFIPPSDVYIPVEGKYTLDVYLLCFDTENSTDTNFAYFEFGHKDELNEYDYGFDFLEDAYWYDSSYFYSYYERRLSYVWHTHKNTIDKEKSLSGDEKYDYLIFSGEATYDLENIAGDDYVYYPAYFVLTPNAAGTKTVHIIEEYFDFLDVLSSTGGIFASVNSFCALIALYFIWGFEIRCIKFRGWAKNSDPSQIEARKFEAFVTRTVDENYTTKEAVQKLLEKQAHDLTDTYKKDRKKLEIKYNDLINLVSKMDEEIKLLKESKHTNNQNAYHE